MLGGTRFDRWNRIFRSRILAYGLVEEVNAKLLGQFTSQHGNTVVELLRFPFIGLLT